MPDVFALAIALPPMIQISPKPSEVKVSTVDARTEMQMFPPVGVSQCRRCPKLCSSQSSSCQSCTALRRKAGRSCRRPRGPIFGVLSMYPLPGPVPVNTVVMPVGHPPAGEMALPAAPNSGDSAIGVHRKDMPLGIGREAGRVVQTAGTRRRASAIVNMGVKLLSWT